MIVRASYEDELRYDASEFVGFDYDDKEIVTWVTMPGVLAIRIPGMKLMFYYDTFPKGSRTCHYRDGDAESWLREIGWRIRHYLDFRGMTQKELANELGTAESVISRYLGGNNMMGAYTLMRIAKILDISVNDLIVFDRNINDYEE